MSRRCLYCQECFASEVHGLYRFVGNNLTAHHEKTTTQNFKLL